MRPSIAKMMSTLGLAIALIDAFIALCTASAIPKTHDPTAYLYTALFTGGSLSGYSVEKYVNSRKVKRAIICLTMSVAPYLTLIL